MLDLETIERALAGMLPDLLGVRITEASPDCVRGTLLVRDDLCTVPGLLHGGAIMAFADTLGAVATAINLRDGAITTTIESKTNFLSGGRAGTAIDGCCTPLHRGGRTMVWQTRVSGPEGRLLAVVTQTQAVIERRKEPLELLAEALGGRSPDERRRLVAQAESRLDGESA